MIISLISAISENGVIGKDNDLPWHLPADLQHFKKKTTGHTIIMGRKTFESVGKPLPNRVNIVISRQPDYLAKGCIMASSLEKAIDMTPDNKDEVFICGGAAVYKHGLQLADRLYITRVHQNVEGDTFFPELDLAKWKETEREYHEPDEKNHSAYSFITYDRS